MLGCVLAAAACSHQAARAEKTFAVTPFLPVDGGAAAPLRTVRKNEVFHSARTVFALLATADADIYGVDGAVKNSAPILLAHKGDQMFGVVAANGQLTYCLVDNKAVGALNGVFVNNSDKHTCFIDADHDGRFEASYDLRTKLSYGGPPIYFEAETRGNPLPAPISYSKVDPLTCKLQFWLETVVSSIGKEGRRAKLAFRLRTADSTNEFGYSDNLELMDRQDFTQYGARMVISFQDRKTVGVTVEKGFDTAPFETPKPTICYGYC